MAAAGRCDFEDAKEIERENEHDRAHRDDEIGVGELERPGDFAPGGLERDHEQREPDEPGEDAGGESEAVAENARATVPGVLDKAENLERDHRQDARHEVEDETADESEEEELEQIHPAHVAGAAIFVRLPETAGEASLPNEKATITSDEHPGEGLQRLGRRLDRDGEDDRPVGSLSPARMPGDRGEASGKGKKSTADDCARLRSAIVRRNSLG